MTNIFSHRAVRFLALALGSLVLVPAVGWAEASGDGRVPLVTIRFNQPAVAFDQQLYGAISKAVAAKPGVMFEVVSRAPVSESEPHDKTWQAIAGRNTRHVLAVMAQMGVPAERISVMGKVAPGLEVDETLVFVQ